MNQYTPDNEPTDEETLASMGLEASDLDGVTLDELIEYLEDGKQPRNEVIENSPGCQIALSSLERVQRLTPTLVASEEEQSSDDSWVSRIMSGIALDARAGKRIPLPDAPPGADFGITEGAMRGLIRSAEDAVPGVLISRCKINSDLENLHEPLEVTVDISVPFGARINPTADIIRQSVADYIQRHAHLPVRTIDITVSDVRKVSDSERKV